MCVFSCSWRFTFYLLAFIAGLAALIDVSTAMLTLSPHLQEHILIQHLPNCCTLTFFVVVGRVCCDTLTSRFASEEVLTHPNAESVDKNTPVEFCRLTLIPSLLPETLAV